jgi:hypothetical protein
MGDIRISSLHGLRQIPGTNGVVAARQRRGFSFRHFAKATAGRARPGVSEDGHRTERET